MPAPESRSAVAGPTVVVTRPAAEARAWADGLVRAGCAVIELPLIEFAPPDDVAALSRCRLHWREHSAIMWVSPQAIAAFGLADLIKNWPLPLDRKADRAIKSDSQTNASHAPDGPRCWVTGPGSARALRAAGVPGALIDQPAPDAAQFDTEALWAVVAPQVATGFRLLVVRGQSSTGPAVAGGSGREWLAEQVVSRGGTVAFCAAYARACPPWTPTAQARIQAALAADAVWLFSSSEAVANLARWLPRQDWSGVRALATHPRIAEAARALGFGAVGCVRPSVADVCAALKGRLQP